MLGFVAQNETGNTQSGGLFHEAPGIGQTELSVAQESDHRAVANGICKSDSGAFEVETKLLDTFTSTRMYRKYERNTLTNPFQGVADGHESLAVINSFLTMKGCQRVASRLHA
jgi:hypothetical protein